MTAQIIFVTLYLGLVTGPQPVALQVTGEVRSVRLLLDGQTVATLTAPPWETTVDFGPGPLPRDLVAIGLDGKGNEIVRAVQTVNVPRPTAEVNIALHEKRISLTGRHLSYAAPTSASLKIDDVPVAVDAELNAKLPDVDMTRPHVIAAQLDFADGAVARHEVVVGGRFAESIPAQLTAVALKKDGADCFTGLHSASIDKPDAQVIVVRDPDPRPFRNAYPQAWSGSGSPASPGLHVGMLDPGTLVLPLWPIANHVMRASQPTAEIFPVGAPMRAAMNVGFFWIVTRVAPKDRELRGPRRWADAVAVAGVRAMEGGRRRAVVLILSDAPDGSSHRPAAVRNYLAAIGVPLFVWASRPASDEDASAWGEVTDVSTVGKFSAATKALRDTLDAQRIAWVDADPVAALRAVKPACRP